ncbi:MAG: hypothetical protein RR959_08040 [Erysipelotrichaceae bacterium]
MNIFISEKKLKLNQSYKSGLSGGTIIPETNELQKQGAIRFKERQNAHYRTKGSLYFNYLDKDMICVNIEKVV